MSEHTCPGTEHHWAVHRFTVDRVALRATPPRAGDEGAIPSAAEVVAGLDRLWLVDGMPFFVEADGSETGVWSLNRYLATAVRLGGLKVSSVQRTHSYHLARLLRFVRGGVQGCFESPSDTSFGLGLCRRRQVSGDRGRGCDARNLTGPGRASLALPWRWGRGDQPPLGVHWQV